MFDAAGDTHAVSASEIFAEGFAKADAEDIGGGAEGVAVVVDIGGIAGEEDLDRGFFLEALLDGDGVLAADGVVVIEDTLFGGFGAGEAAEVAFDQRLDFIGREIADDDEGEA